MMVRKEADLFSFGAQTKKTVLNAGSHAGWCFSSGHIYISTPHTPFMENHLYNLLIVKRKKKE
jgi:hypothetical protein